MIMKGHFIWYALLMFGNISFCRCAINRLSHALPRIQNIFTNGAMIRKIYSACSFADVMFSSGNFGETSSASCLSCTRRATLRTNLHISVFLHMQKTSKSSFGKFPYKKPRPLSGKIRKLALVFCFFPHKWPNLGLRDRGYPYCQNALLIFMTVRNKYSRAMTVGIYAFDQCHIRRDKRIEISIIYHSYHLT